MPADLLTAGLAFLKAVQAARHPVLDAIFMFFHYLGQEPGYLVMAPAVFWLRRDATALKLLVGLMLTWFLNAWLKHWFDVPRPFVGGAIDAMLDPTEAPGASFPSGHAQIAAFFFVSMSLVYRRWAVAALGALCVLGIGASRLYLGVHYPHDVAAGYLVGAAVSIPLFLRRDAAARDVRGRRWLAALLPAGMLAILPVFETLKIAGLVLGTLAAFRPVAAADVWPTRAARTWAMIGTALALEIALFAAVSTLAARLSGPARAALVLVGFAALGAWIAQAPALLAQVFPTPESPQSLDGIRP